MYSIVNAPSELADAIQEFFPEEEWDHAASIAKLESDWSAFALADTTDDSHPCGTVVTFVDGVPVTAELSIGWFQINACNFPDWPAGRFYNTRHNVGTAHLLWSQRGWQPWFFSARTLGIL